MSLAEDDFDVVELAPWSPEPVAPVREMAFRANAWSPEDDARLRELFAAGSPVSDIAETLGRGLAGLQDRLLVLGLRRRLSNPWNELEDAVLCRRYGHEAAASIALDLGRATSSVYLRAQLLGLSQPSAPAWTPWEDAQLRAGYAHGLPPLQVAAIVGRTFGAVNTRASKLGIRHRDTPPDWSNAELARALALAEEGHRYLIVIERLVAEGFPRRAKAGLNRVLKRMGYGRGWGRRWTSEEDDLLRQAYTTGASVKRLMKDLGRTVHSAKWRAEFLGLTGEHPNRDGWRGDVWTPEEEAKLREVYGKVKPAEIGLLFGRTKAAVFTRAWSLGLNAGYWRPYTAQEELAVRIAWRHGISVPQVALALGRRAEAVYKQCERFNLSFADPARPKSSSRGRRVKRRTWTLAEILALEGSEAALQAPPPSNPCRATPATARV